jgi:hypothetical protein
MDDGQVDPLKLTYRVVAVRPDGTRVTLEHGATHQRAEELKRRLLDANAFPAVDIELEEPRD